MPLGVFERELLRLLATNRNPDSYVGGATVLNQNPASPRTSKDVDVFHDTIESLGQSADRDIATLKAAGFKVEEAGRRHDTFCRALVRRAGQQTKIEWVFDSAFRFFPVEASSSALELIARLPLDEVGCLYLNPASQPVCPAPAAPEFPKLTRHFGSIKGAWPRIVES